MAYIVNDVELGFVDLSLVDTVGPGPLKLSGSAIAYGRYNQPGIEVRGTDPVLGGGTFLYVQFTGTVSIGTVCELSQTNVSSGTRYDISALAWAGATITGKPLGVSMCAATTGQWGWVQIQGLAITAVSGAPAVGNPAAWQASGVISPTIVAGKSVINAQFASAVSATVGAVTLTASQALVLLNRPSAQGPIT
jgi:hypothetical protein